MNVKRQKSNPYKTLILEFAVNVVTAFSRFYLIDEYFYEK